MICIPSWWGWWEEVGKTALVSGAGIVPAFLPSTSDRYERRLHNEQIVDIVCSYCCAWLPSRYNLNPRPILGVLGWMNSIIECDLFPFSNINCFLVAFTRNNSPLRNSQAINCQFHLWSAIYPRARLVRLLQCWALDRRRLTASWAACSWWVDSSAVAWLSLSSVKI